MKMIITIVSILAIAAKIIKPIVVTSKEKDMPGKL
jgi:hypothetical protein